ncbi:hypothetical protein QWZ13_04550 [Reinekea marina]|uniref:hypothetical protein n=1 Tax=Reinekea marina TaxID=1310421 RepID=UPI0025B5004F|nr:hypothetical protein [Reinekea marina]MDN3648175.1 hypothetical protein [Reinekea marina]
MDSAVSKILTKPSLHSPKLALQCCNIKIYRCIKLGEWNGRQCRRISRRTRLSNEIFIAKGIAYLSGQTFM